MTLVEMMQAQAQAVSALTQALTAFLAAQQAPATQPVLGMTDVEAQAFAALQAQVATLAEQLAGARSAVQTLTQTVASQAGQITDLAAQLQANTQADQTLKAGIGDLSQLEAQP